MLEGEQTGNGAIQAPCFVKVTFEVVVRYSRKDIKKPVGCMDLELTGIGVQMIFNVNRTGCCSLERAGVGQREGGSSPLQTPCGHF